MTDTNVTPFPFLKPEVQPQGSGDPIPMDAYQVAVAALHQGIVKRDRASAERLFNCLQGANFGQPCVAVPEDLLRACFDEAAPKVRVTTARAYVKALEKYNRGEPWQP